MQQVAAKSEEKKIPFWGESVDQDGVESTVYGDGSGPGFVLRSPDATRSAVNERLNAQRKRYGHKTVPNRGCVIADKSATLLDFRQGCGYLKIDGDLGRAHYPQTWSAGFLPLIPMARFWAWFNSPNHPRPLFEYTVPRLADGVDAEAVKLCAEAYLLLLGLGWDHGFVNATTSIRGYHRILTAAGYDLTAKETRECLDRLVERGWFEVRHWAISKEGWGYPSKNARRYSPKSMYQIIDSDLYDLCEYEKRQAFYGSLFERFTPFLSVPSLDNYDTTPQVEIKKING